MIEFHDTRAMLDETLAQMGENAITSEPRGWQGPEVEWACGTLAATMPPPQVMLSREYIEDNSIEVDEEYILRSLWAVAVDQGYRLAIRDQERGQLESACLV